jgi:hypothetical protein
MRQTLGFSGLRSGETKVTKLSQLEARVSLPGCTPRCFAWGAPAGAGPAAVHVELREPGGGEVCAWYEVCNEEYAYEPRCQAVTQQAKRKP